MKSKIHKRIYKALVIAHAVERRAILIALALMLLLSVSYAYWVASAIVSTVVYKEMRMDVAKLHSKIAASETSYIAEKQSITNDLAISLGLTPISDKKFVKRIVHVGRAE